MRLLSEASTTNLTGCPLCPDSRASERPTGDMRAGVCGFTYLPPRIAFAPRSERLLNAGRVQPDRLLSAPFSARMGQLEKVRHVPAFQFRRIVPRDLAPWSGIPDGPGLWERQRERFRCALPSRFPARLGPVQFTIGGTFLPCDVREPGQLEAVGEFAGIAALPVMG